MASLGCFVLFGKWKNKILERLESGLSNAVFLEMFVVFLFVFCFCFVYLFVCLFASCFPRKCRFG